MRLRKPSWYIRFLVSAVILTYSTLPGCTSATTVATPVPTQTVTPMASPTRLPTSTFTLTPMLARSLAEALTQLCWVAYSPTHFDPTTSPARWPSEEDLRADLQALHAAGFNGLVTYSSHYENGAAAGKWLDIPRLAGQAGFEGMIVGVWDPKDEQELKVAEQWGNYPNVVGYSVGNEGLDVRYDVETLKKAMQRLRQSTAKPVTTTEQVTDYYENSPLWKISDWIFPNAHPYFSGYRNPQEAVGWTEKVYKTLQTVSDKPLMFKEVGLPSSGEAGLSESNQAQYYQLLRKTPVQYVVFEAFDAPWKHLGKPDANGIYSLPDPEPHWGIFTSERAPKLASVGICTRP
jgi:exo-beta-1,3-glucanase (GH17 family)